MIRDFSSWLKEARSILSQTIGAHKSAGKVRILVVDADGHGLEITLPPLGESLIGIPDDRLREVHRRLIAVCTTVPVSAKRLASLAGYAGCNSHVRQALTELVRWGLLLHSPDGYRLPA